MSAQGHVFYFKTFHARQKGRRRPGTHKAECKKHEYKRTNGSRSPQPVLSFEPFIVCPFLGPGNLHATVVRPTMSPVVHEEVHQRAKQE